MWCWKWGRTKTRHKTFYLDHIIVLFLGFGDHVVIDHHHDHHFIHRSLWMKMFSGVQWNLLIPSDGKKYLSASKKQKSNPPNTQLATFFALLNIPRLSIAFMCQSSNNLSVFVHFNKREIIQFRGHCHFTFTISHHGIRTGGWGWSVLNKSLWWPADYAVKQQLRTKQRTETKELLSSSLT